MTAAVARCVYRGSPGIELNGPLCPEGELFSETVESPSSLDMNITLKQNSLAAGAL